MGNDKLIHEYSAGGIVFSGSEVLILSNHRGDIVFPKGHLENGETNEQAALREVEEEAGIIPRIILPLGKTQYRFYWPADRTWRTKVVEWFLMETDNQVVRGDGVEIVSGRFVPPEEAQSLLTYVLDREKLKTAAQLWSKRRSEA